MTPAEIIDRILGFIGTDRTTLKTCSTVFPQNIVDRHLYSHITLRTPNMMEDDDDEEIYYIVPFSEFIPQLLERPQIAFCVLGLRIVITVVPAPFATLELLPVISSMLPIFRNVKSIELSVQGDCPWLALGSDFGTSFQNLLRFPSINEVTISNINGFPLDSFDDCKNLSKLVLRCGQFTDGEGVSTTSSYPHLSSLHIESETASDLTKPVSWMKSNTLHTLSLQLHQSKDFPKFHPLIEACASTLVNLELDLSHNVQSSSAHPDMSAETVFGNAQFPVLKYLVLRSAAVCLALGNHSSSLPHFVPFLTALSRTSSPRSVQLSVHLQFRAISSLIFVREDDPEANIDIRWPDITFLDGLSVFRYPIELHIRSRFLLSVKGLFERSSSIQKLIADGKLIMIDDWV